MAITLQRTATRRIANKTHGTTHGMITRLMSPGDLGQVVKPFVFLDLFDDGGRPFPGFGMHPHSGIATLTYILEGRVSYEDTNGATGILEAGGVEWMQAGKGVWHGGGGADAPRTRGYQLWIALSADKELGPSVSYYQAASDIPVAGPARVLLGSYGDARSVIEAPSAVTYLAVHLADGERWTFEPEDGHDVLWAAVAKGALIGEAGIAPGELAVFERGSLPVEFVANGPTEFVLGSAVPHPHDLVLGYYSVHTSDAALLTGEAHIREIGDRLREEGRL